MGSFLWHFVLRSHLLIYCFQRTNRVRVAFTPMGPFPGVSEEREESSIVIPGSSERPRSAFQEHRGGQGITFDILRGDGGGGVCSRLRSSSSRYRALSVR